MITKNSVVRPGFCPRDFQEAQMKNRLLVVTEMEEVFGGLFIVEAKELGKIETPVERYWDWALEEIPV